MDPQTQAQPQATSKVGQGVAKMDLASGVRMAVRMVLDITNLLTRLAMLALLLTFIDCDRLGRLASRIDAVGNTVAGEQWISILVMAGMLIAILRFIVTEPRRQSDQAR